LGGDALPLSYLLPGVLLFWPLSSLIAFEMISHG
jgi:hypothetical protein